MKWMDHKVTGICLEIGLNLFYFVSMTF